MPINTALYRMAERAIGGSMEDKLREYRAEGISWEGASARLFSDYHLEITGQSLRRWARELGIVDVESVAS